MKKLIAIILALVMVMSLAACAGNNDAPAADAPAADAPAADAPAADAPAADETPSEDPSEEAPAADTVTVMTHEEYIAAAIDSEVVVEFYVQDTQGWWFDSEAGHGKITVYGDDQVGGYFVYELNCAEEDAAKLVPGTKIRVTGYKAEWEGEVEIMDATFEFVEGADTYIAEAKDLTDLLGTEELINSQNQLVAFKGLTVESITYKNDGGDDIWLSLSKDGTAYSFTVEVYLTGTDSEVYTTVGTLEVGDVVDVEGFLYWYQGSDPHITAITVVE